VGWILGGTGRYLQRAGRYLQRSRLNLQGWRSLPGTRQVEPARLKVATCNTAVLTCNEVGRNLERGRLNLQGWKSLPAMQQVEPVPGAGRINPAPLPPTVGLAGPLTPAVIPNDRREEESHASAHVGVRFHCRAISAALRYSLGRNLPSVDFHFVQPAVSHFVGNDRGVFGMKGM
jgi:hypothetical protein